MMIKCPSCGSTAQVKYLKRTIEEDGDSICVIRKYKCGCAEIFHTTEYYYSDCPETVDEHVIWDD